MPRVRVFPGAAVLSLLVLAAPQPGGAQNWRTVTMSRQLAGEDHLDVRVRFDAGRLVIRPAEEDVLYRMHLRYDEDAFQPLAEYEGERLDLGVEGTKHGFRWRRDNTQEMELALARAVPMKLDVEFGAVRADVDLGGITMTTLDLSTGASESTVDISRPNRVRMSRAAFEVGAADFELQNLGNLNAETITVDAGVGKVALDFRGDWQGDADVSVDMGLGSLELRFPEGLGVQLSKDAFLTSLDSEGLVKHGESYYSLNWEEAEHRVTVSVDAAFGSIDVVWVR